MAAGRAGGLTRPTRHRGRIALTFFAEVCYGASARNGLRAGGTVAIGCRCGPAARRVEVFAGCWGSIMRSTKPTIIELDMDKLEDVLRRAEATTSRRRLRDAQGGGRVLRLPCRLGGRQEHEHRSPAEAALRREDREDRGGGRQAGSDPQAPALPTADALPDSSAETNAATAAETAAGDEAEDDSAASSKGHGRNGADAYTGAEKIEVPHESLEPGDPCPKCEEGTVYETNRPGVLVRLMGQAPIGAKVYYLQKLRCNLCGEVFTAEPPAGVGEREVRRDGGEHDRPAEIRERNAVQSRGEAAREPGHSLAGLDPVGHRPRPGGACRAGLRGVDPASGPRRRGVQRRHHGQDPGADGRAWPGKRRWRRTPPTSAEMPAEDAAEDSAKPSKAERTGMFTSGIVSTREGRRIALFFSGRQHAGENLKDVLTRRAAELAPPIQMCDALSRNLPAELQTIVANCLAHGRRQFVDVADRFPEECRHVLEALAVVYHNDAMARERKLSPRGTSAVSPGRERSDHGGTPCLACAAVRRATGGAQLGAGRGHLVPAEALGEADALPARAGAPLDNNLCERALKKAILHRKNAKFRIMLSSASRRHVFQGDLGHREFA